MELKINHIYEGNSLEILQQLPDESVDCIVTSPPYYGLRDYGIDGQIGLENSVEEFINNLVAVFSECRRVLKKTGTCWVNMGDSYAHNGAAYGNEKFTLEGRKQGIEMGKAKRLVKKGFDLKPKDLIGVPWMLAFALRADGWYLRQDIIWSKPNPMPESVRDRCTKAHEYIFLLTKQPKYYYDRLAIMQPIKDSSVQRLLQDIELQKVSDRVPGKTNGAMKAVISGRNPRPGIDTKGGNQGKGDIPMGINGSKFKGHSGNFDSDGNLIGNGMANKRSVWTVSTKPFKEAHFATFPEELITPCILAGCPKDGIVLDPFMGAGTTALVALSHGRSFIGIELNPSYIQIAEKRLKDKMGIFY